MVNFQPKRLVYPDAWIGHIPFAAWLISQIKPSLFVELGTHSGNSYLAFCQAVKEEKLQTRCFAVDTWKGDEHAGWYGEDIFLSLNDYHKANYNDFSRLLRMKFNEAVSYFLDSSIDLLHIDGFHTYEAVKHDFETWYPKLAPHALVIFHDTNVRGKKFGIWRFWDEIIQQYPLNFEFVHSHGLGIIQLSQDIGDFKLDFLQKDYPYRIQFKDYFVSLGQKIITLYKNQEIERSLQEQTRLEDKLYGEIKILKEKLVDQEMLNQTLGEKLIKRNQSIQALDIKLITQEQSIKDLEEKLLQVEMKNKSQEEDQLIKFTELRSINDDYRKEIGRLEGYINQREQILQDLNSKLLEIYGSRGWRLIKNLWKFRLFLAPNGTRREKLAKSTLSFMNRIRNKMENGKNHSVLVRKSKLNKTLNNDISIKGEKDYSTFSQPHNQLYSDMLSTSIGKREAEFVDLSSTDLTNEIMSIQCIAFYLPQYHPIKENNIWWGKGFTEWTNVSKAVPQFIGHYQPHLPGELGFYDLRVQEIQRRQVELAKKYGLRGFCFYYYWFDGKRLLEQPLDQFVADPEIDFPFCICWANENWTRRWDGLENEILIEQVHSEENDFRIIEDMGRYFEHPNYIKIDDRPLVIIYRAHDIYDPTTTVQRWRSYCQQKGFGNPYLVVAQTFDFYDDPRPIGFDAAVEFPPFGANLVEIKEDVQLINENFSGHIYDYREVMRSLIEKACPDYPLFKTLIPTWDNTPRKIDKGSVYLGSSPALYQDWLAKTISYTIKNQKLTNRFVFINAWNEWGEGAYLEPDRKYGYAYLQATANALKNSKYLENLKKPTILFISHDAHLGGSQKSLFSVVKWLSTKTNLKIKVLFLENGRYLGDFESIVDTFVLPLKEDSAMNWITKVVNFCGNKPDLIVGNTVVSTSAYPLLREMNVPILTHVRELETAIQKYYPNWIENIIEEDQFISVTNAVKNNLITNYSIQGLRISTIHNFIKPSQSDLLSNEEKQELRLGLNLPIHDFLIMGAGVGMPFRKGIDLFYGTANELIKMNFQNFHFYWIGGNFDLDDLNDDGITWKEKLELYDPELMDKITILGLQENVMEYLKVGDIFLLTSREEPFGRVVLEAADVGLPTIMFAESGGASEIIEEDTGFVVPYLNVQKMAEKVAFLMTNDDIRIKFGKKSRERLISHFSSDVIMPKLLSKFQELGKINPRISIIVTNFNHATYLRKRMESIFNQTFKDFEVIIMDDCSTDASLDILLPYSNYSNVTLIQNEKNSGSPFKQWMEAFSLAKGDIIWIAESDDWSDITFLEKLIPAFDNPETTIAYCASSIINENDEVVGDYRDGEYLKSISETRWNSSYYIPGYQEVVEAIGIKNTILNMSSVLFRKMNFGKIFEETITKMHIGGDTYLLLNLLKYGNIYFEPSALNYHRRHSSSIVGKIIHDKSNDYLRLFFDDFYLNHKFTIQNYSLDLDFYKKFDKYIHVLWKTLAPNLPFDKIRDFMKYDELIEGIYSKISIK